MGLHVALKCSYNNGGQVPFIGYMGTCSDDIISYNLNVKNRPNCNRFSCRALGRRL